MLTILKYTLVYLYSIMGITSSNHLSKVCICMCIKRTGGVLVLDSIAVKVHLRYVDKLGPEYKLVSHVKDEE